MRWIQVRCPTPCPILRVLIAVPLLVLQSPGHCTCYSRDRRPGFYTSTSGHVAPDASLFVDWHPHSSWGCYCGCRCCCSCCSGRMLVCNLISHFAQTAGKVVHPQYYGGCFFENRSTRCSPLLLLLLFFIRICLHHLLLPLPFFRQSIAMRIAAPRSVSWLLHAYVIICQMSLHHV